MPLKWAAKYAPPLWRTTRPQRRHFRRCQTANGWSTCLGLARQRLLAAGVPDNQCVDSELCTVIEREQFFIPPRRLHRPHGQPDLAGACCVKRLY